MCEFDCEIEIEMFLEQDVVKAEKHLSENV